MVSHMVQPDKNSFFSIAYTEHELPPHRRSLPADRLLNDSCDGAAANASKMGGLEQGRESIALGPFPGKQIVFNVPQGNGKMFGRCYLAGGRLYMIMCGGAGFTQDRKSVQRFFESFAILEAPPVAANEQLPAGPDAVAGDEETAAPDLEAIRQGRFIKPTRSKTPTTYLHAVSSPGDYIGGGATLKFEGKEITVHHFDERGVEIRVGGWTGQFGAPRGGLLRVGRYLDAKRYPFSGASPGIEFIGPGRGANNIAGKFAVWELEIDGNKVNRLALDFVQHCENTQPPLYGIIRFNSSFD